MQVKVCVCCDKARSLYCFDVSKSNKDGLRNKCKDCRREESNNKYVENKPYHQEYYKQNQDHLKSYFRDYYQGNKPYYNKKTADYRAKKLRATPPWLTEKHQEQIIQVYKHARECEMLSGDKYHVDHIVPLQGKNISGLHVPWNLQVLPADINISKKNKTEGEEYF